MIINANECLRQTGFLSSQTGSHEAAISVGDNGGGDYFENHGDGGDFFDSNVGGDDYFDANDDDNYNDYHETVCRGKHGRGSDGGSSAEV